MTNDKVKISSTINADIKTVWNAWNSAEHMVNWNFASDDWNCPKATIDLKVGGIMNSRMEAKDGSFGFDFKVIFDEILENEVVAYTMEDGRKAITTFKDNGDSVDVQTLFDPENENPIELQQGGWQSILNNFKKYTEGL